MCGITGIFRWGTRSRELAAEDMRRVAEMNRALAHRGPNGQGLLDVGGGAVLGHTRLSILDLSSAAEQPMQTEDCNLSLVFNGEIYNYRRLRSALADEGARFRSTGDTEVLLRSLEVHEEGALSRIDGMFAFAAFDSRRRKLLLARDRAGKKPLFFHREKEAVIFASELGALRAGGVELRLRQSALADFLLRGFVPDPLTLCEDVGQLLAGEAVTFDGSGRENHFHYWRHPWLREGGPAVIESDPQRAIHGIRERFRAAVAARLDSDVPLGAFLSGGVDSAAVVAVANEMGGRKLETFTIGFEGAGGDETGPARETADFLGTHHREQVLAPSTFDLIAPLVSRTGEPQGDPSLIPTYLVSRLARQHVTVALSGDGGDELFGGYARFLLALGTAYAGKGNFLRWPKRLLTEINEGPSAHRFLRRLKRWVRAASYGPIGTLVEWAGGTRLSDVERMLGRSIDLGRLTEPEQTAYDRARSNGAGHLHSLLVANFQTYLPGDILIKIDRASMAHGLEVRSPFLDTSLIEYSASLAPLLIARGLKLKWILKQALKDLLPPAVSGRRKHGFEAPVGDWFRGPSGPDLVECLTASSARIRSAVDPVTVSSLVRRHQSGVEEHGFVLFRLLALEEWLKWLHTPLDVRQAA